MNSTDYKKTSIEFRRMAANMLKTQYEDGNKHVIRFAIFIKSNNLIMEIINDKIKGIEYDYIDNFVVSDGNIQYINMPVSEGEHVKAMYDYLMDLSQEEEDLRVRARNFYHYSKGNTYNEIIQAYLSRSFKPLVNFVVDELSKKIIEVLEMQSERVFIEQNIHGNNYGTVNAAHSGITSNNSVTYSEIQKCIDNVRSSIEQESLDQEVSEDLQDDLNAIEEQMQQSNPNKRRIRKIADSMKELIVNIPQAVELAINIADLCSKLNQMN